MKRLQSPTPNRKGVHEIHDVPDRKVAGMLARGWIALDSVPDEPKPLTADLSHPERFDMSGPWMKVRARVRDILGLESVPSSKDEARVLLEDAGYEVTG